MLGYLYDMTGVWTYTFGLGGFFIGLSGLLLLTLPCFKKILGMQTEKAEGDLDAVVVSPNTTPGGTADIPRSDPVDIHRSVV